MSMDSNKQGTFSDINVTPLVDVMLVLLVIFMITAPMMFNGISLTLPKTKKVHNLKLNSKQIILSIASTGDLYIGNKKFLITELTGILQERLTQTKHKTIYIRADYGLQYGKSGQNHGPSQTTGIPTACIGDRDCKMKLTMMRPVVVGAARLVTELRGSDPLYKYFGRVLGGHVLFFLIIYLFGYLGDGIFSWKSRQFKLIQSSVKVDIVAMPQFTQRELQQMGIPKVKGMAKNSSTQQADQTALKQKSDMSFIEKIKQFSKKKVKVKRFKRSKNRTNTQEKKLGKLILAGNKLSSGMSLTGNVNSKELSELRLYMESLPQLVRPHWILPSYLKEQNLQCRIRIFIGKGGKLLKATLVESSGDLQYDDYALQAIQKTQFPTPKHGLLKELVQGVVVLGFPL